MRRPNGTGTIVKMPGTRRKPYAVRIPYKDKRGRVHQKYLSYHATPREAQDALDAYNAAVAAGQAPAPDKLSTTLQQVYDAWSERKYARAGNASVKSYTASWGRLSALAGMKIRDITVDHLQSIIDQGEQSGLSKSSINNDKTLMKALFAWAMERDIIGKDYSAFVKLPHVDAKYEKGAFNDLQMKKIEQMAADGVPWADTVLMLCYTGFRITEFLELTRFSYNADEDYLQGGVKTAAGKNRIVPVHPKIKPYLDAWLAKGGRSIVCRDDGSPVPTAWYRTQAFAPLMAQIGADTATPHWCRHTFSTKLHAAGVPELEQKRLLGHADKNVTEHYTHTDITQLRKAIKKLA